MRSNNMSMFRALMAALILGAFKPLGFADDIDGAGSAPYAAIADGAEGEVSDADDPTLAASAEEARAKDQASLDETFGAGVEQVESETNLETGETTSFETAAGAVGNEEDDDSDDFAD